MQTSTPVTRQLDELSLPYRTFTHPGPVHSLQQAAAERGQRPEQVVRSILFRLAEGDYALMLVAGPGQLSWQALRKYFGVSRMSMASEDEVLHVTGYHLGAVSPFGLPTPLRIVADENVFLEEEVSIGSGVRGTTVILRQEALQAALGAIETGEFCCT